MNDIKEFLEIISLLGGSASIDEIASAYAKRYKMPTSLVSKSVIASTLKSYNGNLRLNRANGKYEPKPETKAKMLCFRQPIFRHNPRCNVAHFQ